MAGLPVCVAKTRSQRRSTLHNGGSGRDALRRRLKASNDSESTLVQTERDRSAAMIAVSLHQSRNEGLESRQRILCAILQKVSEPTKADMELIAREFFGNLSHEYRAVVAEEMRPVGKGKQSSQADAASAFEAKLRGSDQAGLNPLLLGMALLDATFNTISSQGAERLEAVAQR